MLVAGAMVCGFILDLMLGDPGWMPQPVVMMGRCIDRLERIMRRIFPETEKGLLAGGTVLAVSMAAGTLAVTAGICVLAYMIHPAVCFAVQTMWCWQALAAKGLRDESRNVYRCLTEGKSIEDARQAVGRIVGRDTGGLSREGVIKAAVETVAENFSDGVFAPMFYIAIGGAPLGMTYKAINTMDSMIGYKNDEYIFFGRAAARFDDAANYVPSRIAALFFIISAVFAGGSIRGGWHIWRRDSANHASPNSAQTESACAGALGIQLAGPAYYFGKLYDKPFIGDAGRCVVPEDIKRTWVMMYGASVMAAAVMTGIRAAVFLLI